MAGKTPVRCAWVALDNDLSVRYHDEEWGVPLHDDRLIFEHLLLETAQAGLSWLTILRKRAAYREAFAGFDPQKIAAFTSDDVEKLLQNPGIVRNRQKIVAAIDNARQFLLVQKEFGSFAAYQWHFVGGQPIQNAWQTMAEVPATTPLAKAYSNDLKKRGFRFVGPVTLYAHMQATGMVNDHTVGCFRHAELTAR